MKWDAFSVAQIAAQLSVTEQNIRRIMSSLRAAGVVEEAGEEFLAARGRPAKLYRLKN
jgi:predicted ArsR family transcriptional regulator